MDTFNFITKKGKQIETVFDELASLRITVFHDYPYLYEGTVAYEKEYLQPYVKSDKSFLFAVYDQQQMVGATTCLPLSDEVAEIKQPFIEAGYAPEQLFYFGESILLPAYRGRGLGHRFFDEREQHARSFGTYQLACFFSVARPDDHPSRPTDYRPNDRFWEKRGYRKQPQLRSTLSWPDIGETQSTPKTLTGWMREL